MGLLIKFSISSCFTMSGHRYINFGENQASIENGYQWKSMYIRACGAGGASAPPVFGGDSPQRLFQSVKGFV